jgi:peptide/nickel transport system permease protein
MSVTPQPVVVGRRALLTPLGRGRVARAALRTPALWVALAIVAAAALAPVLAPYGATEINVEATLQPPSAAHWFGTDTLGMDVYSRVLYGARKDLLLAFAAAALACVLGVPLGAFAGYVGGWFDSAIQRLTEILQAFPIILLAMAILIAVGPTLTSVTVVIAIINVPVYFRVVRSVVLGMKTAEFVDAARCTGNSNVSIVCRHLLPNVTGPVIAQFSVNFAWAIQIIAGLSFLGLAVRVPDPEWGLMVQQGAENVVSGEWWIAFFPGAAIFLTVLVLNWIGAFVNRQLRQP